MCSQGEIKFSWVEKHSFYLGKFYWGIFIIASHVFLPYCCSHSILHFVGLWMYSHNPATEILYCCASSVYLLHDYKSSDDNSPLTGRDVFDSNNEKRDNSKECETLVQIIRENSVARKLSKKVQCIAKNNKQKSANCNSLSTSSAAVTFCSVAYGADEPCLLPRHSWKYLAMLSILLTGKQRSLGRSFKCFWGKHCHCQQDQWSNPEYSPIESGWCWVSSKFLTVQTAACSAEICRHHLQMPTYIWWSPWWFSHGSV